MFPCPEAAAKVFNMISNDMWEFEPMAIYTHLLPTLMDFQETSLFQMFVAWGFRCDSHDCPQAVHRVASDNAEESWSDRCSGKKKGKGKGNDHRKRALRTLMRV